jgi:hypothetical protein
LFDLNFKKYCFLNEDVIKRKFIYLGSRIRSTDIMMCQMSDKFEFEFQFYDEEFYKDPLPVGHTNSSIVITLSEKKLNEIFIKEIRKEKLLCLKK